MKIGNNLAFSSTLKAAPSRTVTKDFTVAQAALAEDERKYEFYLYTGGKLEMALPGKTPFADRVISSRIIQFDNEIVPNVQDMISEHEALTEDETVEE